METQRASRPVFSRAAKSKSVQSYLDQLDELTKRNKGGFSSVAEDTGTSVPFMLPGRAVKSATPEMASQRQMAELPKPEEYPVQDQAQNPDGSVLGQQSGMSVSDFINNLYQSVGASDSLYQTGVGSSGDGGTILSGGETIYPSGNIRTPAGEDVYATGSAPGGGILYSDGRTRYIDPTTPGLEGLMQILNLSGQTVTQDYGNYNPSLEPGSGYNMGTDIRTRDLANKAFSLPFEVRVLQVFQDDGTQWGDQSGHQGYGNSVLLELPTGEAIRLSHLSALGDQFQPGQVLPAGSFLGIAGSTGNTQGEHLDLEFYNKDGQLSDPSTFSGFTNPEKIKSFVTQPVTTQQPIASQPSIPSTPTAPTAPEAPTLSGMDKLQEAAKSLGINIQEAAKPMSPQRQVAGSTINNLGEQIGITPLGIGEAVAGNIPEAQRELAGTVAAAGQMHGMGEGMISESIQNPSKPGLWGSARQALGQTVENIGDRLGIPENNPITGGGLSEMIAGGPTARSNIALAYSGPKPQSVIDQEYNQAKENFSGSVLGKGLAKAGEGIDKLKSGFSGLFGKGGSQANLFSRPSMSSMGQNRAVGNESGMSLLPASVSDARSAKSAMGVNDIRDPFFKSGMADKMGIQDKNGGALSLDLFDPTFFQDPNQIKSVFGGTQFEQGANQKYQSYVDEQRRQEEARRQSEQNQGGQSGSSNNSQPSYNSAQSNNNIANYATGSVSKQLSQPKQSSQKTPIYQPYAQTQQLMRQVPASTPQPQQSLFQKAGSAVSNLFKKWFQ